MVEHHNASRWRQKHLRFLLPVALAEVKDTVSVKGLELWFYLLCNMDLILANGHPWPGLIKYYFKCLATGGPTSIPIPSKTFYFSSAVFLKAPRPFRFDMLAKHS